MKQQTIICEACDQEHSCLWQYDLSKTLENPHPICFGCWFDSLDCCGNPDNGHDMGCAAHPEILKDISFMAENNICVLPECRARLDWACGRWTLKSRKDLTFCSPVCAGFWMVDNKDHWPSGKAAVC